MSLATRVAQYFLIGLVVVAAVDRSLAQSTPQVALNIFGPGVPRLPDNGDPKSVVLGVKVFLRCPGQVLGCSFYKAPANVGVHVVSLWDASGKLLASQTATKETPSGKQTVLFSSPVSITANQTFICGYHAPDGPLRL